MKPGWKTTEFWTTTFAQGLAVLAFLGVLSPGDSQTMGEALSKMTAAAFTLIANAAVVIHYIRGRMLLKMGKPGAAAAPTLPLLLLTALMIGLLAGTAQAAGPATQQTAWLPWRVRIEQQLQNAQRPAPAPQQTPIIIYPPLQQLPIQGDPKQQLPIQGDPKQQLPIPGQPLQPLPIPGQPLQPLPGPGQPLQPLPVPGQPQQPLPFMPPADGAPQSYTVHRALARPIE